MTEQERKSFLSTVTATHGDAVAQRCARILSSSPSQPPDVVLACATSDEKSHESLNGAIVNSSFRLKYKDGWKGPKR